jgi:hypothetical protein
MTDRRGKKPSSEEEAQEKKVFTREEWSLLDANLAAPVNAAVALDAIGEGFPNEDEDADLSSESKK